VTRSWPGARQYETHCHLLAHTSARLGGGADQGSLDAIIVPASRPAANLDHAVTLARALSCHLVVICSHRARAAEVNELLASRNFTRAIVIDLPTGYTHPTFNFNTSKLDRFDLPADCINPNVNLSTKRNLGLLLAKMLGWERIFFLDDDIRDLSSSDLCRTASMLGPYRAVGMRAVDFPDNSVVCHGHRSTGGNQDVFISGSVLAVHCAESVSFFPEIYNEDWFFFYHYAAARKLGWSGRDATQLCYDPFADPQRAAGQEFGDVLAEGLFGLLHRRIGEDDATGDYWRIFLDARMRFLEAVLARAEAVEPYLRGRIVSSVETAIAWSGKISPSMCEGYVKVWKQDLDAWQQRLTKIPRLPSAKAALSELLLTPSRQSPYMLAGIIGGLGGGASMDVAAGQCRIPSGLASGMGEELGSIIAPQGVDNNSGSYLPFVSDLPSARRRGDALVKGVVGHMSRRVGKIVRRAIVAEERSGPAGSNRNREGGRLAAGKHRKASEPGYAPSQVNVPAACVGYQSSPANPGAACVPPLATAHSAAVQ